MPFRVMVADDDPGIRLAVRDYLELSGYQVLTVRDGQEALEAVETFLPQILLVDINMPRKDGHTVVRKLRQNPRFRHLPVVFLTHLSTTSDRIRGYESGCDVYLPKPFELDELAAVVRSLVQRWQAIQSEWQVARPSNHSQGQHFDFTEREGQVLEWLTIGLSNGEIGQKLFLSPRTVEKYVSRLLRKTETNNRAELIRYALTHHLVE
ncbi:MAG: response regulator transcription factor [Cyanobacteria bacterium J06641_5]